MFDFSIDRPVTDRDFVAIISEALGVAESDVTVISSLDEIDSRQAVAVYVLRTLHGGQFAHAFNVIPTNSIKEAALPSELDLATKLVERLNCQCLISDDSPNPYSWILVSPGIMPRTVFVDVDGFGEHDQLTIIETPAGNGKPVLPS